MSPFQHITVLSDLEVRKVRVFKRKVDSPLLFFLNKSLSSLCSKLTNRTHTPKKVVKYLQVVYKNIKLPK